MKERINKLSLNLSELLNYPKNIQEAKELQLKWKNDYLNFINKNNNLNKFKLKENIQFIAGVDISYFNFNDKYIGVACAVVWSFFNRNIIEIQFHDEFVEFPYISGLLAFREGPLILKSLLELNNIPDLILFDGHGKFHPIKFGEAVHLGYALRIPSIGIAKRPIMIEYKWNKPLKKGLFDEICIENEIIAYALVIRDNYKPVFISEGFNIRLKDCLEICIKCAGNFKEPEPLALAHIFSKGKINELKKKYLKI